MTKVALFSEQPILIMGMEAVVAGSRNVSLTGACPTTSLLIEHVAGILGCQRSPEALLRRVQEGDVRRYMLDTRRVLRAWVFRKRFAVSILNVELSNEIEGEQE